MKQLQPSLSTFTKSIFLAFLAVSALFSAGCKKESAFAQSAKITRVELRSFPAYQPDGTPWDTLSNWPDIYFTFEPGTTVTGSYFVSSTVDECADGTVISWNNLSVMMNDLDSRWTIGLFDSDGGVTGTYMNGFNFPISNEDRQARPDFIDVDYTSIWARLYLTWY